MVEMAKYNISKYEEFQMRYFPILIPVVTILLLGFILGYCFINGGDKPAVTCDEATEKLIDLGYEPVDATYNYKDKIVSLKKCVYANKDDVVIFFFELDDDSSARSLHISNNSQISNIARYRDWEEYHDNYSRYSALSYDNTYYDSVLVGNTVVYAQCNDDNKNEVYKFITAIKYNASTQENREK